MENEKNAQLSNLSKSKRLSITMSRFSTLDGKLVLTLENKRDSLIAAKNASLGNPSLEEPISNLSNSQTFQRESIKDKVDQRKFNLREVLKPLQLENSNQASMNQCKSLQKSKQSGSITKNKNSENQHGNRLSLEDHRDSKKSVIRIIDLLRGNRKSQNQSRKKRILSQDSKNSNNFSKDSNLRNSLLKKGDESEKNQNPLYLKLRELRATEQSDESSEIQDFAQNQLSFKRQRKSTYQSTFSIWTNLYSICISTSSTKLSSIQSGPEKDQKADKQIQTYQSEPEVFQYLTYKRKKQQYESELQNLFKELETIKYDQKMGAERVEKIGKIYEEGPKDEREERIFALKKQIHVYSGKILAEIDKKHKEIGGVLEKAKKIDNILTNGFKKLQSINKSYIGVFKQFFQKHQQPKHSRIATRIQSISSNVMQEIYSQIKKQMESCYMEKEGNKDLKFFLMEFMKCMDEKKVLLRNCFQHIKYMPELFLKLFGDEIQEMNSKDCMAILDFALKKKELTKCIKCYNTDRKMSLIVQKNAQIQSVLKVADQLVS